MHTVLSIFSSINFALLFTALLSPVFVHADNRHALSVYDEPIYPEGFKHFRYVNPAAPRQGHLRLAIHGSFDSLNPYILKGSPPTRAPFVTRYGFSELNEPLMVGTGLYQQAFEEFGTAYGLIAKSVSLSSNRRHLTFHLRPEARFHDGHPITAVDVAFSYKQLSLCSICLMSNYSTIFILRPQMNTTTERLFQEISRVSPTLRPIR